MPDEFSDGPVHGGAPWLAWKECAWDGFVQWPFFSLPIAMLFIMLLFKYSFVVGLLLLLQCLSVQLFPFFKKEKIVPLGHSYQSNPGKITELPHSYNMFQSVVSKKFSTLLPKEMIFLEYIVPHYIVPGLKTSRWSSP